MDERSKTISRLRSDLDSRISYIRAKLNVVVPSKIRALRLKSDMPRQSDLARAAQMHQSRVSMFETPGAANFTLETLARLAAVFKVGLVVDFVPFSEMLHWENTYSQDSFDVTKIDSDREFIEGIPRKQRRTRRKTKASFTAIGWSNSSLAGGQSAVRNDRTSTGQQQLPFGLPIAPAQVIPIPVKPQTANGGNAVPLDLLLGDRRRA
jgi:transcriptional regulator with XRE-family HTH domain